MGVLFPRNRKKKPMYSRHILRASVTGIRVSKFWRPDAVTNMMRAGVSLLKTLNLSIPKNPSKVANFNKKEDVDDGYMKY